MGAAPEHNNTVREELQLLARTVPAGVHCGTSSWSFPGWAGIVYDAQENTTHLSRHGLRAYAQHPLLTAVGIDRTYYGPIPARTFAEYADQVPDHFRFLVKAHSAIVSPFSGGRVGSARTGGDSKWRGSAEQFLDPIYAERAVVEPAVEGLGEKLGVILFQFPPIPWPERRLAALPDALGAFLSELPKGVPYAVEVRNRTLLEGATLAAYRDALAAGGASHGFVVHPEMPGVLWQAEQLGEAATGSAGAHSAVPIRWMLHPSQEYEAAREAWAPFSRLAAPDPGNRREVASLAQRLAALGKRVLVIVNNKAEGSAPLSIEGLAREWAGHPTGFTPG